MKKLLICLVLLFTLGCNSYIEEAYKQGKRASSLGVSAESNPYQGYGGDNGRRAESWLNGWMDAREQRLKELNDEY